MFNQFADKTATLLGSVKAFFTLAFPEWAVSLTAEPQCPYYFHIFLALGSFLPEANKALGVFSPGRSTVRISSGKDLCSQRLCMMVCDPKTVLKSQICILAAAFISSGDYHISSTAKQGFKGHAPREVFWSSVIPVNEKYLIV